MTSDSDDALLSALREHVRAAGAYGIFRLQDSRTRSVSLEGTRVESVGSACATGLGVQVFTEGGHTGFGVVDDPTEARALAAAGRAVAAARAAEAADLAANPAILALEPLKEQAAPPASYPFDHLDVGEMRDAALGFAESVSGVLGDVHASVGFGLSRDDWRIGRTDGTDVQFSVCRSSLRAALTARRNTDAARAHAIDTGMSYELLLDDGRRRGMIARTGKAADLATRLLDAPSHPAGSYPLLIDFALAKGLAHEAFGHAAESDSLDASILGRDGKFRAGERFGGSNVTIIDESVDGDNAYQPFSGNGVRRERAVILDRGILRDALADAHTAGRAETRVTGAARLESFASVPIPRMSNIRIEVDDPWPVEEGKDFYDWTPEEVRALLVESGDLDRLGRVLFLSGYKGGQVNAALGDFVFHSTAMYEFSADGIRILKPGIFSGRIEAALHSIARGFGPLRLDAAGICGKAGQGVPSSGGSHHFLLLDEHPELRIGGTT